MARSDGLIVVRDADGGLLASQGRVPGPAQAEPEGLEALRLAVVDDLETHGLLGLAGREGERAIDGHNAAQAGNAVVARPKALRQTGKAAAAKAAKARIAAGKASKAKGEQTAAGKARAALSKSTREAKAAAAGATVAVAEAPKATTTKAAPKTTKATSTKAAATKAAGQAPQGGEGRRQEPDREDGRAQGEHRSPTK